MPNSTMPSALDVARFFLDRDSQRAEPDVTPMKLAKLMYFAQANNLADTGSRLFNSNVEAFEHGPVVHEVWKHYPAGAQILAVTSREAFETESNLDQNVIAFLNKIWQRFSDMSASKLRSMTHRHRPWSDHYSPDSFRAVIPDEEMRDWFRSSSLPSLERVHRDDMTFVAFDVLDQLDDEQVEMRFRTLFA